MLLGGQITSFVRRISLDKNAFSSIQNLLGTIDADFRRPPINHYVHIKIVTVFL